MYLLSSKNKHVKQKEIWRLSSLKHGLLGHLLQGAVSRSQERLLHVYVVFSASFKIFRSYVLAPLQGRPARHLQESHVGVQTLQINSLHMVKSQV